MIDLFAGIGGFRLAAERCGGECVGFSEIDADAVSAYVENFDASGEQNFGDIKKIAALPKHDLLTGGVPCQSWSIAGRNMGFDDDRGQLWNDALYLLKQSKPKAFIFENVKGLSDPRNSSALEYIMARVKEAGYHAGCHTINSADYGVPQSRVRIYIIGFADEACHERFNLPAKTCARPRLGDVLDGCGELDEELRPCESDTDLFGEPASQARTRMSLSANNNGHNDYFLFNDLRNGATTVHSWELLETTEKQKHICMLLLMNRRKRRYGYLDGNPLALAHFQELDGSITQCDIDCLVDLGILKPEQYAFAVNAASGAEVTGDEAQFLAMEDDSGIIIPDSFASSREWKAKRLKYSPLAKSLLEKGAITCSELRYDFRNTKISTGLFGVNRVFLPQSSIFPTLVASDSNDYITDVCITAKDAKSYKEEFVEKVYRTGAYRRVTKAEALRIQGFPEGFVLPEARARWMKLIGNSVAVPLVEQLVREVCRTGAFA